MEEEEEDEKDSRPFSTGGHLNFLQPSYYTAAAAAEPHPLPLVPQFLR